jgi:membrane protein DedA with SNARE-associated domain
MDKRLARWGWLVLLFSRFVPGVRSVIALSAGIAQYPLAKMALLSTISYFIFSSLLLIASTKLFANLDSVVRFIALYNKIIWPILIILVLWYVIFKIRRMRNGA